MGKFSTFFLLSESKQEIVNLGFPKIIADIFYQKFGKYAFLIAKWFRDYHTSDPSSDWWLSMRSGDWRSLSLPDLVQLYIATNDPEQYAVTLDKFDLHKDEITYEPEYLLEQREKLKRQIEAKLFDDTFFYSNVLVNDILSGKLKNIAPYKDLRYYDAQHKYDEKRVFEDATPVKTYPNGWKWINAGPRCMLIGKLMKNCGGTGVMSGDPDRTMIVLFDPNNKPHVITTYSPNEKRLSGDEGGASSAVKPEYHDYVIDLADTLGAEFDTFKSKSALLGLKYRLRGRANNFEIVNDDPYNEIFKFNLDGENYYFNGQVAVPESDLRKADIAIKSGQLKVVSPQPDLATTALHYRNQPAFAHFGVRYIPYGRL